MECWMSPKEAKEQDTPDIHPTSNKLIFTVRHTGNYPRSCFYRAEFDLIKVYLNFASACMFLKWALTLKENTRTYMYIKFIPSYHIYVLYIFIFILV
jgi:hypothetical protein